MGFRIEGFSPTVEYQGGNRVVQVREYHVYALPSETYFQFRRPKAKWDPANIRSVAKQFSDRIEAVLALPNVTDVIYTQDVTLAGRLQDRMTTFYQSADGSVSGSVEQPLASFGPGNTGALVADALSDDESYIGAG